MTHARTGKLAAWVVGSVVAGAALLSPCVASAQAPVRTFDQLDTRVKAGDTVWVTDVQGRKTKGKVSTLDGTSLTLRDGEIVFKEADVRVLELKRHENLKGGTLVGLAAGIGIGVVSFAPWCRGPGCVWVVGMFGAMGAGIGCGVDALIPENRRDIVYSATSANSAGRISIAPVIGRKSTGVALSFRF